ncbi:MAG: diacylglycerol kinase family lipid kinase [Acidobacteriota bacterium]|nr:diacylglycerol kinase family lipid kinase [Acidobacteriota bacterium]
MEPNPDFRFVINPNAGRGRSRKCLTGLGEAVDALGGSLYVSESASDLTAFARAAVEAGVGRLVAAGGDGTFHHVIQGLAGTACELGMIPLGRGNDLANALGVPADWRTALDRALESPARRIDLGVANGHYYALYCGVGFDSEAGRVANTQSFLKGPLAYPYGVLRTLIDFEPPIFNIEYDGGSFEGPAMLVNVTNCNRMGGGMKLTPDAKPDDGRLDMALGHAMSRLTLLRLFAKIYRGTHVGHPAVTIEPTKSARIEVDRPLEVNADGERLFVVYGALEISVAPGALTVAA